MKHYTNGPVKFQVQNIKSARLTGPILCLLALTKLSDGDDDTDGVDASGLRRRGAGTAGAACARTG